MLNYENSFNSYRGGLNPNVLNVIRKKVKIWISFVDVELYKFIQSNMTKLYQVNFKSVHISSLLPG